MATATVEAEPGSAGGTFTPSDALAAIDGMRAAVEDMLATEEPDAIAGAAEAFDAARQAYDIEAADDQDAGWAEVEPVLSAFLDWLEQAPASEDAPDAAADPAGSSTRRARQWASGAAREPREVRRKMTRDEKIRIAVAIASRGRARGGGRRRDAIDKILDGLDAGVAFVARNLWRATKAVARAAGKATWAAGEALGAGIVHVAEYIRDGKVVAGHDRKTPGNRSRNMPTRIAVRSEGASDLESRLIAASAVSDDLIADYDTNFNFDFSDFGETPAELDDVIEQATALLGQMQAHKIDIDELIQEAARMLASATAASEAAEAALEHAQYCDDAANAIDDATTERDGLEDSLSTLRARRDELAAGAASSTREETRMRTTTKPATRELRAFDEDNTEGWTDADMEVMNAVLADLVANGVDESSANDLISEKMYSGMSEDELRAELAQWLEDAPVERAARTPVRADPVLVTALRAMAAAGIDDATADDLIARAWTPGVTAAGLLDRALELAA